MECPAPSGVANADDAACLEGRARLPEGSSCTAKCLRGFSPSVASANCTEDGQLEPPTFACIDSCTGVGPLPRNKTCEACWCDDARCGHLLVLYTPGAALVARALLGHLTCTDFRPWHFGEVLARADILVATPEDLGSLRVGMLQTQGFTGAIVLVDVGCDLQEAAKLPEKELLRRLFLEGVAPPAAPGVLEALLQDLRVPAGVGLPDGEASGLAAAAPELFERAGRPPSVPPALRCWDSRRTMYVGADRAAAAAYAAALELPPGALAVLRRAASGDLDGQLAALRAAPPVPHPSVRREKLLAYLADECLPEAEAFFDLAVGALAGLGLGAVEALGACCGSHPEARPSGWTAGAQLRAAHLDRAAALAPYRFALAFEASANSGDRCPRHVGGSVVLEALAAGTVPVYRGPLEAWAVINEAAVLVLRRSMSLQEGLEILRAAALCKGKVGWYDGGEDRSCDEGCAAVGLVCTEEALLAHSSEVERSADILELAAAAGGVTAAARCDAAYAWDPDVPQWNAVECQRSAVGRELSTFNCSARPARPGEGRHRLCFCHSTEGCTASGGWLASAPALPAASAARWFDWDQALRSSATELGLAAVTRLGPLAAGSPRARCVAFGREERASCERLGAGAACTAGAAA